MTLRQTIQAAPGKTSDLIAKLSDTSNQAVKTREGLFAQLRDELTRYVEVEEQHFLPLLRKHDGTRTLAADALKGSKDLRASLSKLNEMPKDSEGFLAELEELNKSFQQHLRNERKELLPAVLKAFSDEEAGELAEKVDGAIADAEEARREEKRKEAAAQKRKEDAKAKRDSKKAEKAAADAAAARARDAAGRARREAAEKAVQAAARRAASDKNNARQIDAAANEQAREVAADAQGALAAYTTASQKIRDDLKAVRASSTVSAGAVSEMYSAWMGVFSNAARINAGASQQLFRCTSLQQVAELQRELATSAVRNVMEGNARVLKIAQNASKKAMDPLDLRLQETS